LQAGAGVGKMSIYSERVLPWLSDNLCAHFERNVRFEINDHAASKSLIRSNQPLHSNTRLDLLMETKCTSMEEIMDSLQVNQEIILPDRLRAGVNVELEHGTKFVHWQANVTRDDLRKTAQIALAHLIENPGLRDITTGKYLIPDYYHMLADMEKKADDLWKGLRKPAIFLFKRYKPFADSQLCMKDIQGDDDNS
jgi:hypothetical protein